MIRWNPALAVGHATIDAQHEEIFVRLNRLLEAMLAGDRSETARLFDFVGTYVVEHFGAEERLMSETRYPNLAQHKAAHDRFVEDYGALRAAYDRNGASAAVTIRLKTWVVEWLKGHIAGTDQALARHLVRSEA